MDKKPAPWGRLPAALDLRKLLERLELPEMGRKIVDAHRKDIDALIEANREAYRAIEALGQRQQEILRAALAAWQEGAREVIDAPKVADKAQATSRRSQQAFARALADLRSLSELVLESNRRVLGVLDERARERLGDTRPRAGKTRVVAEHVHEDSPKATPPSRRKPVARRGSRAPA